jgi:hypothetical protein
MRVRAPSTELILSCCKAWNVIPIRLGYSGGELDSPENFLPAHRLCNKYRWDYLSEEFQWILKMGVWSRTLMQNSSPGDGLGRKMAERFFKYEQHNEQRRENQNKKSETCSE